MRKYIALLAFLLLNGSILIAQEYEFYEYVSGAWTRIPNGATITRSCKADSDEGVNEFFGVRNVATETRNVWARRQTRTRLPGSLDSYCWNGCMNPEDSLSVKSLKMEPGKMVTNQFDIHFRPNNVAGSTTISYSFFDRTALADSAYMVIKYVSQSVGIDDAYELSRPLSTSPNPADSWVRFRGISRQFSGKLVLTNLLGQRIKEIAVPENSTDLKISTATMTEGIYFYFLETGSSKGAVGKLIVKR